MKHFVSRQCWLRLSALAILLALGLVHSDITEAQSLEYRLGPGDRIQVKVFGRADLSGVYTIRSSGFISLPIAGDVEASGLSLGQLEMEIGNRYSELMKSESGPDQAINVNIEIVTHRPFYIMGDVSKPGSYEYQKRLTVLSAIAIAGGYASAGPSARVNETRARENLNVNKSNYIAAIAREARLIAELKERDKVSFPPELVEMRDDSFVSDILDIERQLFTLRRELLTQELQIIDERRQQFGLQEETLAAQSRTVARKREDVDELLAGAQELMESGLLPKFDILSFEILQSDIERESRELVLAQSRARQGMSEMEQQALILRGQRAQEIAGELERVRLQINEILLRLSAEADRLAILRVKTVTGSDSEENTEKGKIRVTRETHQGTISFDATENTAVLPGDIISVPYQEGDALLSLPDRGRN